MAKNKVKAQNEIANFGRNEQSTKQSADDKFKNGAHLEKMGEKTIYTDSYKFINDICDSYKESVLNWFRFSFLANYYTLEKVEKEITTLDENGNKEKKTELVTEKVSKPGYEKETEFLKFAFKYTKNFSCRIVRILSENETKSEKESETQENATKEDSKAKGDTVTIRERIYKQIESTDLVAILLSAKGAFKYSKSGKEKEAKEQIKKVSLVDLLAILTPEQKKNLGII